MHDDLPTPARVADTVWLIRHLAASAGNPQRLPGQVQRLLVERSLCREDGYVLLTRLVDLLPRPLCVAPPCCTLRSRHERIIAAALLALETDDRAGLRRAMQDLAAPVGMSDEEVRRAGDVLARLAGYDPSMRCRRSRGNGGAARGRTASDTSDTALSSPAIRFDLRAPHL